MVFLLIKKCTLCTICTIYIVINRRVRGKLIEIEAKKENLVKMAKTKLLNSIRKETFVTFFSSKTKLIAQFNCSINKNNLLYSSKREITSAANPENTKCLKGYEDLPGPPEQWPLGHVLSFKNPETGSDPKYILKTANHLWETYGDIFKLEIPSKPPFIW